MFWQRLFLPEAARATYRIRNTLTRFLFFAYGIFLTGFFVFPQAHQRFWFYCGFLLPVFLPLAAESVRRMRLQRSVVLAWLFIAYMMASVLWSDGGSWRCTGTTVAQGLLTASFLSVSFFLMHEYRDRFCLLLDLVSIGAAVFGLASMLIWYTDHPFPGSRLVSFSKLNNPVLVGLVYGPFALLMAARFFSVRTLPRRTLSLIIFTVLCSVILLTQSRNVFLATLAGLGVIFWHRRKSPSLLVAASGLILLGAAHGSWIEERFAQGLGYRSEIWRSTVTQISAAPLVGHGYCCVNSVKAADITFVHAHSGYLTVARDGGLTGLALLVFLLAQLTHDAIVKLRRDGDPAALALMVYAVVCLFPDTDRLLTFPKEEWLYFWLPVVLASAQHSVPGSARRMPP